jgi:predicted nucleic acid-binding protein
VAALADLITKTYLLANIPEIVSDSKDNYLFALCAKSKADYLVSGDKIVLQTGAYGKTKMITLNELEMLINHK